MPTRVAITNQKGGVGKTVLAANLGGALAELGHRVLLVDLDPQGHLTHGLGCVEAEEITLAAAMIDLGKVDPGMIVERSSNLDLIPTSIDHFLTEQRLHELRGREYRLRRVLDQLDRPYDWILIDAPPHLGDLADNGIVAARRVLVPLVPDGYSLRALELLLDQINALREMGVDIEVLGLVANLVDDTRVSQRALGSLAELSLPLLGRLRRRTRIREAHDAGQTVLELEPTGDAAEWFRDLARQLTGVAVSEAKS